MKEESDPSKNQDENSGGWTSDLPPPKRDRPAPASSRRIFVDTDDVKAEEARLERAYNEAAAQSSPLSSPKPAPGS